MKLERSPRTIDPSWFRNVLGQYPTGVCVVTGLEPDVGPAGMVIGSFTSVSLTPPLVAFFPDKSSSTWPRIERSGAFCVNILSAEQETVCRTFASKRENKFEGHAYRSAPTGSPVLAEVTAWIDCDLERVDEAGDHYIVLGRVRELDLGSPRLPLLFYQGGYGRFTPSSLTAPNTHGTLARHLRHVDLMRPELESLAADLGCHCTVSARDGDEIVVVGAAGRGATDADRGTLVGQRFPFIPPTSAVFVAWSAQPEIEKWLTGAGDDAARAKAGQALRVVRERGYSIGLLSGGQRTYADMVERLAVAPENVPQEDLLAVNRDLAYDPAEIDHEVRRAIRQISAPVFDAQGVVALALTVHSFSRPQGEIDRYIERLIQAASASARRIAPEIEPV